MSYAAIPEKILEQKIGDSIIWEFGYSTTLNLTGYSIKIEAISKLNETTELFSVDSLSPTSNAYITTDLLSNGKFSLIIKDTSSFINGDYYVDVVYTNPEGIKKSTKTIILRMLKRF